MLVNWDYDQETEGRITGRHYVTFSNQPRLSTASEFWSLQSTGKYKM